MKTEFATKKSLVADRLREMIVSGELHPGTRLRQQDVAREFGVSPTPVREAIEQLKTEGFLESTPHVGVRVAAVRRTGVEEVYEIRSILEGRMAAEAAKSATDEDVGWLRQACREFAEAAMAGDTVEARAVNYRLHHHIWELANQSVTLEIIKTLWAKFPWDLLDYVPGRGERSIQEHAALVEAIAAHDPKAAERALQAHISSGRADFVASMDDAPGTSE